MLCNLVVENYALISKLEIEFRKGLTIITGETGAGKSILLGALSLILGKRADTSVLYDKEKKCIVEGTFDIAQYGLSDFFTDNGIDYDDQTIVRREISATGKSRAFINDIPVNLELLTEFGIKLIDIHSQHQNLNLADNIFQIKVLDGFARTQNILIEYRQKFQIHHSILKEYEQLKEEAARTKADFDYIQFQYTQLDEAHLRDNEQEELEFELEKLTHAGEIKTGLATAYELLQSETGSALQQIKDCHTAINRISKFLHGNEGLSPRIDSVYIELKDIAQEIELLNNQLSFDPERLTQVNERLNLIYSLEQKHRVSTLAELIALRTQLKQKLEEINSFDFNLEILEKRLKEAYAVMRESAGRLSVMRKNAIISFGQKIVSMLSEVGIPNAGFNIAFDHTENHNNYGADNIQFLFSANKNQKPQDIARVASGGELSRLMLCIKSLMSDSTGLPTIIFDEIDTGVSGEIAERVGKIINRMSEKMQIINITHLPQVASKGDYHYLVYKTDEENTTVTRMKLLSEQERHIEIAKMLSGEEITTAALENAKALLGK
jgi:DNA repair protein RecN (Recombination protein N)